MCITGGAPADRGPRTHQPQSEHGRVLCWLGVRLIQMHRVLADDGSMYLHIDHTAHAYTKCLMDAIFGQRNFRNEIVWHYRRWTSGTVRMTW